MTNEEKINLRERALRLSFEIRNPYSGPTAMYMWAEHIYKFLSSDGLSLHEAENMAKVVSLMDSKISEPEKSRNNPSEIDWSWTTPRLVRSKRDANIILETTGRHTQDMFEGIERTSFKRYGWFQKEGYRYHGEIQLEQKTEGLNFLEAVQAAKGGKNIRRKNWRITYWYHSNDAMYDFEGDMVDGVKPSDILATDWQIVK